MTRFLCGKKWTVAFLVIAPSILLAGCGQPVDEAEIVDRRTFWVSAEAASGTPSGNPVSETDATFRPAARQHAVQQPQPVASMPAQPTVAKAKANPIPQSYPPSRPPMLAVQLQAERVLGLPIGLFLDKTLLMRPNGAIAFVDNREIVSQQITTQPFETQDIRSLGAELQHEFGKLYRIRTALPYLVVAQPDRMSEWCGRFQRFHHSIQLFCSTRGIPIQSPEFPLVAIVFGKKSEFEDYARRDRVDLPDLCVGYYSQKTNRIVLFESGNANEDEQTLNTICHEATHQLAFNSGMHQRLAETPLWVAEGFAVQFEAPAYCDFASRDRSSYWPPSQRDAWGALKQDPGRFRGLIEEMVRNDDRFKTDKLDAYTAAWAMSSYLAQRRSVQYVAYLKAIGRLEPFQPYSAGDRMRDFHRAFGSDLGILVRQAVQHIDGLQ